MKSFFTYISAEALEKFEQVSNFFRWLFTVVTAPFVLVFSSLFVAGNEAGKLISGGPLKAIGGLLIFPLLFIFRISVEARRDLFWCLPALISFLAIATISFLSLLQGDRIEQRYRARAVSAIKQNDYQKAKTYCRRVIASNKSPTDSDKLRWTMCLLETGEEKLGQQLLEELAPDGQQGYPPAHRLRSLNLALQLERTNDTSLCDKLRFHLEHSDENQSEAIQTAYALYYLATKQTDRAIQHLKVAANKNPSHYHTLANIYHDQGNNPAKLESLRTAESIYFSRLSQQPSEVSNRIALAKTLTRLEKYDSAERILLDGLRIEDTPEIRRALAEFCLIRHNLSSDFDEKMAFLQSSIDFDLNFLQAYQALVEQFKVNLDSDIEKAEKLEELIRFNLASGKNTALAHFAMSNIKSKKGEKKLARFHSEKAYELDPRFGVVANNLAWFLANDQANPDLDRAFELASEVIERLPYNPSVRDTYATVLMKQEKYEEALIHFEKALSNISNKRPIHLKLAFVYQKLGMEDMQEVHLRAAAKLAEEK